MKISGARIFDPTNGDAGEVRDIHISGHEISRTPFGGPALDAEGCVAMAGGIDIHSHPLGVARLAALTRAPELAGWGDFDATARRYLSLGVTYFVEAGLEADAAAEAEKKCGSGNIGCGILHLSGDGGAESGGFIGEKFIGETGVEEFFRRPPSSGAAPHIHLPHLAKGDSLAILETFLKRLSGRRCHLAHLSHYAFETCGGKLFPAGRTAVRMLADCPNVTFDCGPVVFGPALTFTADDELADRVSKSGGGVRVRHRACRFAASPYTFQMERHIDSLLWLNAMELLLSVEDVSRVALSIDYPSGGLLDGYPFIIACLMDAGKRNAFVEKLNPEAVAASAVGGIARQFSLSEIAAVTRTVPAWVCGMAERGHLGPGAEADIAVYEQSADAERMFANPRYVIRGGKVIIERGIWK